MSVNVFRSFCKVSLIEDKLKEIDGFTLGVLRLKKGDKLIKLNESRCK